MNKAGQNPGECVLPKGQEKAILNSPNMTYNLYFLLLLTSESMFKPKSNRSSI